MTSIYRAYCKPKEGNIIKNCPEICNRTPTNRKNPENIWRAFPRLIHTTKRYTRVNGTPPHPIRHTPECPLTSTPMGGRRQQKFNKIYRGPRRHTQKTVYPY